MITSKKVTVLRSALGHPAPKTLRISNEAWNELPVELKGTVKGKQYFRNGVATDFIPVKVVPKLNLYCTYFDLQYPNTKHGNEKVMVCTDAVSKSAALSSIRKAYTNINHSGSTPSKMKVVSAEVFNAAQTNWLIR